MNAVCWALLEGSGRLVQEWGSGVGPSLSQAGKTLSEHSEWFFYVPETLKNEEGAYRWHYKKLQLGLLRARMLCSSAGWWRPLGSTQMLTCRGQTETGQGLLTGPEGCSVG